MEEGKQEKLEAGQKPLEKPEEDKPLDMQKVRKIINGISLFFSLGGFLLILIFGFIAYSALDGMEKSLDSSAKSLCGTITSTSAALANAGEGVSSLQKSMQEGSTSFTLLADSLQSTSATISVLDKTSGTMIAASAASMRNMTASLDGAATGFGKMKSDLDGARTSITGQRDLFCGSKITNMMGSVKMMLLVLLLFLSTVLLVNSLNSAAGVI
ncbi:MAG: hypothetical protein V1492_04540 [Candidatus Micrarchaeota archaeon]